MMTQNKTNHILKRVNTTPSNEFLLCSTRPAGWKMLWKPIAWCDKVPMQRMATSKKIVAWTHANMNEPILHEPKPCFFTNLKKAPSSKRPVTSNRHVFRWSREGPRLAWTVLSSKISGTRMAEKKHHWSFYFHISTNLPDKPFHRVSMRTTRKGLGLLPTTREHQLTSQQHKFNGECL